MSNIVLYSYVHTYKYTREYFNFHDLQHKYFFSSQLFLLAVSPLNRQQTFKTNFLWKIIKSSVHNTFKRVIKLVGTWVALTENRTINLLNRWHCTLNLEVNKKYNFERVYYSSPQVTVLHLLNFEFPKRSFTLPLYKNKHSNHSSMH